MTWRSADRARQDNGGPAARWRGTGALITGAAAAMLLAGCGAAGPSSPSGPSRAGRAAGACLGQRAGLGQPTRAWPGTAWPERRTWPALGRLVSYSGLAVDPVTDVAYALIPRRASPRRGPYRLECTVLGTGHARKGSPLRAPDLALASGYLWAFGQPGRERVILQIDPRSLRVIRSVLLPGAAAPGYVPMRVTAGPGHSVWAGASRSGRTAMLFRLDTRSGRILATVRLPAGTAAYDLAAGPSRAVLYVSAARIARGGPEGDLVLEYDARSGRLLAIANHGLVTYSVAGSALTAVPGGVWVSFRTGMLGLTVHLSQSGLRLAAPSRPGVVRSAPTGLFHWAMYATTLYGGGSLWLANQSGLLACLDPGTGRPRAIERLGQSRLIFQLLAADRERHRLYGADARGLLVITPPAACWAS